MSRVIVIFLFLMTGIASSQSAKSPEVKPEGDAATTQSQIPVRNLQFAPTESIPNLSLSPLNTVPTQCTSDGSLFIDELDVKDLKKHTVVSILGRYSQTYSPANITDLHDLTVYSFFPTDSEVGFLVRGAKSTPGAKGPAKSPAGIPWEDYHSYISEFDRDGKYLRSVELPLKYTVTHFAILPSGGFLVSGYDELNSTARLVFLNSSGEMVRNLDLPAYRDAVGGDYRSGEAAKRARELIGYVLLTPYKDDVLVWHLGGSDPILDVGPGGSVREVPLQPPPGFVFDGLIPSNDRWVAHFRSRSAAPQSALNNIDYSYFDLRPQDASISAKLSQTGDIPLSIACESDGTYVAFKRDKDNKLIVLKAE